MTERLDDSVRRDAPMERLSVIGNANQAAQRTGRARSLWSGGGDRLSPQSFATTVTGLPVRRLTADAWWRR